MRLAETYPRRRFGSREAKAAQGRGANMRGNLENRQRGQWEMKKRKPKLNLRSTAGV